MTKGLTPIHFLRDKNNSRLTEWSQRASDGVWFKRVSEIIGELPNRRPLVKRTPWELMGDHNGAPLTQFELPNGARQLPASRKQARLPQDKLGALLSKEKVK